MWLPDVWPVVQQDCRSRRPRHRRTLRVPLSLSALLVLPPIDVAPELSSSLYPVSLYLIFVCLLLGGEPGLRARPLRTMTARAR